MGLFKKSCYTSPSVEPPSASKFTVIRCELVGWFFVAEIHYANCTNFEGKKVLILRSDPRKMTILDPHFESGGAVAARFEPTAYGWNLAIQTANLMAGRKP